MTRLLVLAVAVFALGAPAASLAAGPDDLVVTRQQQLSPRLKELGFRTPALSGETNVRVLLPAGYDAHPDKRYPVLYLLHGCCDYDVAGSRAWTTHGEVEAATRDLDLIVVMPDGGRGGMYSDWFNNGLRGTPMWERYHVGELVPWIDGHFRTRATREGRVIAGLSMGGYGAIKYAARHPDMFVAAASFSGIVDSNVAGGTVHAALPILDGGTFGAAFGIRATDEVRSRGHNPWDLAENLRPLQLSLRTGNGQSGPLDGPGVTPDPIELAAHEQTVSLHERLASLGIAHTWDDYGPGKHAWPYWARDLRATLTEQMKVLEHPPAPPARVTYTAIEPAYEVFAWHVAIARPALEFSRLEDAASDGFTMSGSGRATVTTPPVYRPGAAIRVQIGDDAPRSATADSAGRLEIVVDLGAPNPGQQYRLTTRTRVGRVAVNIRPAATAPSCTRRVTLTLPRGLRRAGVTVDGRRVRVRHRRLRITVTDGTTVVVRGRTAGNRPYRRVHRYRCPAAR